MRTNLESEFQNFESKDTSIVVFGSLARDEFTSGSDIDWTLLLDGQADPRHTEASFAIAEHLEAREGRKPGREGTFGGLAISHDLIDKIGGSDDSNRNMTQRVLLLLESKPIGQREAYDRVLKSVLRRYVFEDFGLAQNTYRVPVPRFLQNDIARYWRTVAVDFAYKRRQRGAKGWALRTVKLRLSRKLTYAAGLLTCFATGLGQLKSSGTEPQQALHDIVDQLWRRCQMTPLELVASILVLNEDLHEPARILFDAYDRFLLVLDDSEKRARLDDLEPPDAGSDSLFQEAREIGHRFQEGLNRIFLEANSSGLYELTKIYGVF
ncbi:MAG TPA: nucleotidyltransferase domain-containing protein [Blastocatellia bacterium]